MSDPQHTPEPWRFIEHLTWPGFGVVHPIMSDEMGLVSREIGERIVADHNALAGIDNPEEAIREAREALEAALMVHKSIETYCSETAEDRRANRLHCDRLKAALTKLGGNKQ